jgi:hypothetical protein
MARRGLRTFENVIDLRTAAKSSEVDDMFSNSESVATYAAVYAECILSCIQKDGAKHTLCNIVNTYSRSSRRSSSEPRVGKYVVRSSNFGKTSQVNHISKGS